MLHFIPNQGKKMENIPVFHRAVFVTKFWACLEVLALLSLQHTGCSLQCWSQGAFVPVFRPGLGVKFSLTTHSNKEQLRWTQTNVKLTAAESNWPN